MKHKKIENNLTITIKLDDVWGNYDKTVQDIINLHIKKELKELVWGNVKELLTKEIAAKTEEYIKKAASKKISKLITNIAPLLTYKTSTYNDAKELPLDEYVKHLMQQTRGWESISDLVIKKSDQSVKDFQNRYDALLATQLITKMKDGGFLSNEASKILLTDTPKDTE
jgi:nicotinamidase-related amidase